MLHNEIFCMCVGFEKSLVNSFKKKSISLWMWDGFPENRDCCYFVLALSTLTLDTCANKSYEALHILLCLGGCILTYRVGLFSSALLMKPFTSCYVWVGVYWVGLFSSEIPKHSKISPPPSLSSH